MQRNSKYKKACVSNHIVNWALVMFFFPSKKKMLGLILGGDFIASSLSDMNKFDKI